MKNIHAAGKTGQTAFMLQDGEIPFGVRRQGEMVALRELACELVVQTAAEFIRFVKTDAHRVQRRLHQRLPLGFRDFLRGQPEVFRNGDLIGRDGDAPIRRYRLVASGLYVNQFQRYARGKRERRFRTVEFDFGWPCDHADNRRRRRDDGVLDRFDEMDEAAADDAENQQHQEEEMAAAATARRLPFGLLRLVRLDEIRRIGGLGDKRLMRCFLRCRGRLGLFLRVDGWCGFGGVFGRWGRHGDWFREAWPDLQRMDSHDLQPGGEDVAEFGDRQIAVVRLRKMAFDSAAEVVRITLQLLRQLVVLKRCHAVLENPVMHAGGVAEHVEFQRQLDCRGLRLAVTLDVRQQRGVEFKRRDEKRIGPVFRVADGLASENLPAVGVLRKQIDILLRKRNLQRFYVGIACDFFQEKHGRNRL